MVTLLIIGLIGLFIYAIADRVKAEHIINRSLNQWINLYTAKRKSAINGVKIGAVLVTIALLLFISTETSYIKHVEGWFLVPARDKTVLTGSGILSWFLLVTGNFVLLVSGYKLGRYEEKLKHYKEMDRNYYMALQHQTKERIEQEDEQSRKTMEMYRRQRAITNIFKYFFGGF